MTSRNGCRSRWSSPLKMSHGTRGVCRTTPKRTRASRAALSASGTTRGCGTTGTPPARHRLPYCRRRDMPSTLSRTFSSRRLRKAAPHPRLLDRCRYAARVGPWYWQPRRGSSLHHAGFRPGSMRTANGERCRLSDAAGGYFVVGYIIDCPSPELQASGWPTWIRGQNVTQGRLLMHLPRYLRLG